MQSLNQALGTHLTPTISGRPPFHDGGYRLSDSPPTILDSNVAQRPGQAIAGPSISPVHEFAVPSASDTSATGSPKRKQADNAATAGNSQPGKRRRDGDDLFDTDSAHGSKHWTDEEKTKLFDWLMGPTQDDHWNALRATKNSCLREVCALAMARAPYLRNDSVPPRCLAARRLTRR